MPFKVSLKNIILGTTSLLMLSACAFAPQMTEAEQEMVETFTGSKYQPATREMRDNIETQELFAQAAFWSREYDLNPGDLESAIKLSATVRKLGNPGRAVEIAQTARALYPRDPYLAAEFAAGLVASERSFDAIKPLDEALAYAPGYARLWSLKGAALDQQENYDLARRHYARALQITPEDPNIMANIGLSFALSGEANTAEGWLRRAVAAPGAGKNVHQNLALILQLQGKIAEAEKYSRLASTGGPRPTQQSSMPQSYQAPRQAATNPNLRGSYSPGSSGQGSNQTQSYRSPNPQQAQSNFAMIGGVPTDASQMTSASDIARAAARQSANRREVRSAQPNAEQLKVLDQLAKNVGPKSSATGNSVGAPRVQNNPYANQQPAPQMNNGYPAPNYANGYPATTNNGRPEARTRR